MGWCLSRRVLHCVLWCLAGLAATDSRAAPAALAAEIPSEPLARALTSFADQTGLQVIYVSALAKGRISHAAAAGLPAAEALGRLLAGTGLDFEFLNDRTVKLSERPAPHLEPPSRLAAQTPVGPSILEEVLVTATKREERLDQVPVSATVWSPESLAELNIDSIADLAAYTPGVEYDYNAQWGSGVLTNLAIRGIVSKVGTSTTGIYIDDAPIQARNGNFGNPYPATFDLARVEILKGPQSTLFGAGAEGGAVRYITTTPSTTDFDSLYRADLEQTAHGGFSYEAGAAAGGPLVNEVVGARISAWYRQEGGYIDHVDPFTGASLDDHSNDSRTQALRLAFTLQPAETVRIVPSVGYQQYRIADSPVFYEYLSDPSDNILENGKLLRQPAKDAFGVASLKLEARLHGSTLTAESSYFDRTARATVDTTNEAGVVFYGGFGNPSGPAFPTSYSQAVPSFMSLRQIVISQEIRLTSADEDATLRWSTGVFYSRSRQVEGEDTYPITQPAAPAVLTTDSYFDEIASGFGSVELRFARWLKATVGVRVDHIESEFWQSGDGFAYQGVGPLSSGATTATPVTPEFDLDFQPTDELLFYAKASKGYRIGGVNTPLPLQCGQHDDFPDTYSSDAVWSYEAGTKSTLFENRFQLAASSFYLRWSDIQEHEVPSCGFGFVANAGAAVGKGFDLTATAVLLDRLKLGLAVANTDVRYSSNVYFDGTVIVDRGTVVGGVPHVPAPWSGTAYARYQWPLASGLDAYFRADEIVHSHNPGPFAELDTRSISFSPLYTADPATYLLNLQAGLVWPHSTLKLFVDNALDSLPTLQRNADAGASSLIYAYTFRPRTVGITASWQF
jgi:iron complex outermembrane recepter protein